MFKKIKFNYMGIVYMLLSVLGGAIGAFLIFVCLMNSLNFHSIFENESFVNMISKFPAQKVIIKQDQAYDKILDEVKYSIADIYLKKEKKESLIKIENMIQSGQFLGKGVILTTDGWIVSSLQNEAKSGNYIISVNNGKNIRNYAPTKILNDNFNDLTYIKIAADGLSILPIGDYGSIKNGEIVMSVGFNNRMKIDYISETRYSYLDQDKINPKSSDVLNRWLLTGNALEKHDYSSAPLVNLSRELVGIMNTEKTAIPAYTISKAFKSIIRSHEILRSSLGIEYVDLNYLTDYNGIGKGALIYKVMPKGQAMSYGLKEGDIILRVEAEEVKENNLPELIQEYDKSVEINLTILRDKKELKQKIVF